MFLRNDGLRHLCHPSVRTYDINFSDTTPVTQALASVISGPPPIKVRQNTRKNDRCSEARVPRIACRDEYQKEGGDNQK